MDFELTGDDDGKKGEKKPEKPTRVLPPAVAAAKKRHDEAKRKLMEAEEELMAAKIELSYRGKNGNEIKALKEEAKKIIAAQRQAERDAVTDEILAEHYSEIVMSDARAHGMRNLAGVSQD
jgi:hypothetical protein